MQYIQDLYILRFKLNLYYKYNSIYLMSVLCQGNHNFGCGYI